MKPGERLVWAAVYAASVAAGHSRTNAARIAAAEVKNLRTLACHEDVFGDDADAVDMLREMLDSRR